MASNLPPGVSESDLPGNRPEDRLYERLFNKLRPDIQDEIADQTPAGEKLDELFQQKIQQLYTEQELLMDMQVDYENIDDIMNKELDWQKAKVHFDTVRKQYQDLEGTPGVNTTLALRGVFDPLAKRYNNGERTEELYNEMISVE